MIALHGTLLRLVREASAIDDDQRAGGSGDVVEDAALRRMSDDRWTAFDEACRAVMPRGSA